MTKSFKVLLLPVFVLAALIVACNKSEDTTTTEEALDQELYAAQERGGLGRFGCYELVFPISITLPDNSVVEVNSYEEIIDALRAYYQANGTDRPGRPFRPRLDFVFPISVVSEDGEVITLNSNEELRALRAECPGTFGQHGHHGHTQGPLSCFEIIFPMTIEFPDGTTATAGDRQALHLLIRTWHHDHPGVQGRPHIVFPLTLQMTEDGSIVTVNNREELRALKEGCE